VTRRTVLHAFAGLTLSAAGQAPTTVLVELFTSEGCSSCPPADHLLSHLAAEGLPGIQVIALSEHVDYWDRLGWADPFSSRQFSSRQEQYSRRFGLDGVYTPQVVVDGAFEAVGSDSTKVTAHIRKAAEKPRAIVGLSRLGGSVRVTASGIPGRQAVDVLYAVTEGSLLSNVRRGENAGRLLSHTGVVRRLRELGKFDPRETQSWSADVPLDFDQNWKRQDLRFVAFLQSRRSGQIVGSQALRLSES
jgi:hypothetical protein